MTDPDKKTLAFCLFKYFPHGGLQRDMLSIALACQSRGYGIEVYTSAWEGPLPEGFMLYARRPAGLTNHARMRYYHAWTAGQLTDRNIACIVGFNKMPGLDVYFAADGCFEAASRKKGRFIDRLTGRYRVFSQFEAAVFSANSSTEIMFISVPQRKAYLHCYGTSSQRVHLLEPWIAPERTAPDNRKAVREQVRRDLSVGPEETLLLQVGSGFKTKGLDRSLHALASLPTALPAKTKLAVAGRDKSRRFDRLARKLGLDDRVLFLGSRDDVMALMAAADMLIHPARTEAAGVVLIEALVSGLPILCSGACGHAEHIRRSRAGVVLSEPFQQAELNQQLAAVLAGRDLPACAQNALTYAKSLDVYQMPQRAADIIESVVQRKVSESR